MRRIIDVIRLSACLGIVVASVSWAQQPPCQSKCNLQASECMKACAGDPKDAQRPEKAERLVQCLKQCEVQNTNCKQSCGR